MIALARASARADSGQAAGPTAARRHLLKKLGRGSADTRWSGLALALLERGLAERGAVPSPAVTEGLRRALAEANAPEDVGAYAIACGLLGTPAAEDVLLEKLDEVREDATRGHVAVGLGLVGARGAVEPLRGLLIESAYRPVLLGELAIGLTLLADREAARQLLDMLESASSQAAQASIAQALGRIGDRTTIEPLVALLRDEEMTGRSRAFAAVALGIVADLDELPWDTELSVMVNYTAAPATLFDLEGFGLLNIL